MSIDQQARRLSQMHTAYQKEISRMMDGLSSKGEDAVLLCLSARGQAMLSGELMDMTGLTTGRIANILKQLEKKALICRLPDNQDKRRVHVCLTEAGRLRAGNLSLALDEKHRGLLSCLGEEDAREALRLLEKCLRFVRSVQSAQEDKAE